MSEEQQKKTVFDVAMLIPGLPFDGTSFEKRSLGGSESAGLYMAKNLARVGQRVKVFCNTNDISLDDDKVEYFPAGMWHQYACNTPHDVTIVQRAPEIYAQRTASKLNLLWMHDLALGRSSVDINRVMWNVDRVMVVSEWMKEQYKEVTGMPDRTFYVTRNGIDLALTEKAAQIVVDRDPFRLVYSARPERGLDTLLRDIMPKLLERDKRFQLHVYGYENNVEHLQEFYHSCRQYGEKLGDRVVFHDPMTKEKLYDEYQKSSIYVYPTPSKVAPQFAEVSCISVMEAMSCGMSIVCSDKGALSETIGRNTPHSLRIKGNPWEESVAKEFVDAVLYETRQRTDNQSIHRLLSKRAKELDWAPVAQSWVEMFEREIRSRNTDSFRLARHFWRTSDIVALRELEDKIPAKDYKEMMDPFAFAFGTRDDFRDQYARISKTHDLNTFDSAEHEPRYVLLHEWLKSRDDVLSVVDYGCALGNYAYFGARDTGKRFYGIDHDPLTIEMANKIRKEKGDGAPVTFHVGEHDSWPDNVPMSDCALVQEVLEHVTEPWALIEEVEKHVKPDGWVYITVPLGPWEFSSYHTYPWRCHIWHFDQHDLHDMFDGKPELGISSYYYADSPELGSAMGWWIITYKADHKPIRKPNMERKLWLSRPRETVSATMIVGGETAGHTLAWCLESLRFIADELVMVNCGMLSDALEIANRWNCDVVDGPNPLESGFEVARNAGLVRCRMDWVLWIDSDEKIVNTRHVQKYLRDNRFQGYGIRQHHFACDTNFEPDMPVRFFRRIREDDEGNTMRFFGAVHEHPEFDLNKGPGPVVVMSDAHIAHVGYLIEGTRQRRFARNYQLTALDQSRYPERLLTKHFTMRDNLILVREALKSNGGRIDPGIRDKCREVVSTYRKYFLGKGFYANADSLQYYSEALSLLGEGFDVVFSVDAEKGEAKQNGASHYRFANKEDFMTELNRRAEEKVAKFDQPYW